MLRLNLPLFLKRSLGHQTDFKDHNSDSEGHKAGTRLSRLCGELKLEEHPTVPTIWNGALYKELTAPLTFLVPVIT